MRIGVLIVAGSVLTAALPAHAALTISGKATKNVDCSAGVCSTTKKSANLNVAELSSMLASGNVTVQSTAKPMDIEIKDDLTWASMHFLTLISYRSIRISGTVTVEGTGNLTLETNDGGNDQGGALSFAGKGHVTFWDTNSNLNINNQHYVLANSILGIQAAATEHFGESVALANSYDASADGVYASPPVSTQIVASFEGLGNTISNLKVKSGAGGGLFLDTPLFLENLHLTKFKVSGSGMVGALGARCGVSIANVDASGSVVGRKGANTGGICGVIGGGHISNVSFKGSVSGIGTAKQGIHSTAGGLFGVSSATIVNSYSTATVDGADGWQVGGLVGQNGGPIDGSFATGTVRGTDNAIVGGLIGQNVASFPNELITNSYATGFAGGGVGSMVGGLIGQNDRGVIDCYASGPVVSGSGNAVGGLIGDDLGEADLTDTYFDISTTGQSHGVGNNTSYPGVTGLTTEQFQAGLPTGFDPLIWAENANINGGLPYLLALPPG